MDADITPALKRITILGVLLPNKTPKMQCSVFSSFERKAVKAKSCQAPNERALCPHPCPTAPKPCSALLETLNIPSVTQCPEVQPGRSCGGAAEVSQLLLALSLSSALMNHLCPRPGAAQEIFIPCVGVQRPPQPHRELGASVAPRASPGLAEL